MANMQKYSSGAVGGILRHDERTENDKVIERSNESIDAERTHLNYRFTHTSHKAEPVQYIKDFTEENNINLNKRKDLKAMVSWVVTMPTGENGIAPEEQERFFLETNKFLCNRYGFVDKNGNIGNVLSSVVHLDETTPHLHFCFVPVAYDVKNQRNTVSAKLVCSRKDLQTFHKDLTDHMQSVFGRDIGILNGQTEPVQSVAELKAKGGKLERRIQENQKSLDNLNATISTKTAQIDELGNKAKELQADVKNLSERRRELTASELKTIDVTPKRFGGGYKGLSPEQAQQLLNTSINQEKKIKLLKQENETLTEERNRALERAVKAEEQNRARISMQQVKEQQQKSEREQSERKLKEQLRQLQQSQNELIERYKLSKKYLSEEEEWQLETDFQFLQGSEPIYFDVSSEANEFEESLVELDFRYKKNLYADGTTEFIIPKRYWNELNNIAEEIQAPARQTNRGISL